MSLSKLEEIKCPCGEEFEAELWNAVNAADNPELKEAIRNGEINVVCCPKCNQIFYAEHFILYHDSENELLAFVYPLSFASRAEHWKSEMKKDFEGAMNAMLPADKIVYEPLMLFGLESLAQIFIEDEEVSDEAAVLSHLAKDLNLTLIKLKQSRARSANIPSILPLVNSKGSPDLRHQIIEGLKRLLKHNNHLLNYKRFLEKIEKDKSWVLDEKLIKPKSKPSFH